MDTPEDRLGAASNLLGENHSVVRAVIVKTWGSTPREVGADMLIDDRGKIYGTIGGGCGEAEVYELACELLDSPSGPPGYLYHVDLTENPEDGGEKICGGRFDVLLQRLDPQVHAEIVHRAHHLLSNNDQLTWVTRTEGSQPGFWKQGLLSVPLSFSLSLAPAKDTNATWISSSDSDVSAEFCEPMGKIHRLIIVGAGHIARPLCRLASTLGYRVIILDDRPEYAQDQFFPDAFTVIAGAYDQQLPPLADQSRTSVVLVTRGHKHDQDCLRLVIPFNLAYVGMIGSQRRINAVFADLLKEGISVETLQRIRAPIGLEIGARTPAEIAVSILAQMIQDRRLNASSSRTAQNRTRHYRSLTSKPENLAPP